MITAMQRPALLVSAVLRVMHPQLYWASVRTHIELGRWSADQDLPHMHRLLKHWASVYTGATVMCNRNSPDHRDPKCPPEAFDILTCIGNYHHGVMQLTNLDINLLYNPGVMVSYSGRLVRHGINVAEGDRIVWAWFLRDSGTTCRRMLGQRFLGIFTNIHLPPPLVCKVCKIISQV
ncbi:hypothetical protein P692DRAFT_20743962 [Suillus brevipes Sb2]|nr:hypothetical protein P692DRAFT_20743962 [Suillus brevipes Sb2]